MCKYVCVRSLVHLSSATGYELIVAAAEFSSFSLRTAMRSEGDTGRRHRPPPIYTVTVLLVALVCYLGPASVDGVILTPPYFNLAEGRTITASATCGVDTEGPELYCKLVGANAENDENVNVIQGQVCDYCDPSRPDKMHPPEFSVDGMETWWQSPPLSRGMKYNEVNLTIDLGQEFHVAYVYVRMGNSPRPGLWVLEKSSDYGKTYTPWQYFSDSTTDCETYFGRESLQPISRDDSVICSTEYSKIVPLEGGEIPISLLNNRPSANMYFNSSVLQEWTRATNVRLRLLRTKNLLGHLMSVARQDPTVTRRYFYSIKDISIGGRCMCNGHADTCDIQDPQDPKKLLCRCQHHTCGPQCATCCAGFEQKAWRISKAYKKFECEPCNCFNHSNECKYDAEVDENRQSLDIHGNYDGGGVCQNCQHNTEGINCNRCKPTFYRPYSKKWYDLDVCQPCECNTFYSTGNCAEGTGQCECRPEFTPPNCDACSFGYFGYPNCRPCECHMNGTRGNHCEATGGTCPCKSNYAGGYCNKCADTFYKFPECLPCECNDIGSLSNSCNQETGNCSCRSNYRGRTCDQCEHGYYNYPTCAYCNCDVSGTLPGICDKATGQCLCKEGYGGDQCGQCIPGYYGYPDCRPCNCSEVGSATKFCDTSGKCPCLESFSGRTCEQCSPGYYKYPECLACKCDSNGAIGVSCDGEGKCQCRHNFDNTRCHQCKEGFYNFPNCEDCNCNPAGVVAAFAGCASVPAGELCQCKDRVQGRICDVCRPLYWNLQLANSEGCEHCDCHLPGVVGGIGVCDTNSGQCMCKPSVVSRGCSQCADGTYDLQESDLFGCKDCDCDIGGSIHGVCDKLSGQCQCQARITGRTCRTPLHVHYFPTLYQFQYEVEDGRTPLNTPVRYGFEEDVFANYSWKGYAIFTPLLQKEIIQDVIINKPSLYRMVLSYVNPNSEPVNGLITIIPDNPTDIEQKFQVQFKPSKVPTFVTVAGPHGNIPSPLVMNPGRWSVSIQSKKTLYLDYFVLLPAAFYEATILSKQVETPCRVGEKALCRHYSYPNISQFDIVHGDGGYVSLDSDDKEPLTEYFSNQIQLAELGETHLPLLNEFQQEITLNMTVTKPGRYVLLLTFATPEEDDERTQQLSVHSSSQHDHHDGLVTLPSCPYTTLCRQAVIDRHHRIKTFHFDDNYITLTLKGDKNSNVGIKSLVAIPYEEWSLDYIGPKSVCMRKDGKCMAAQFPNAPDSKRVKFEAGNEQQISKVRPPHIHDNTSNLILLDHNDAMVDISSKVPHPGYYVFVVHYYQPDYPEFDMDVLIQNGLFYEAKLPVRHCPSNSGCRALISQEDGNTRFSLTENFVLTLKEPNHKSVWLEYLLVVPAELYTNNILSEMDFDQTGEFISTCGSNHFHMNTSTEGFCKDAVFSLTADYNNGALQCQCDYDGSLSFECEKFGGQCLCKENVIGRKCEVCKTGYYGFPDCKPCNCPSTALCETNTGQCICPPRVTGDRCDQCKPLTFGFDQIIGCEECNCNPLGVQRDLQCDLLYGNCTCKHNIVGRTCDHCEAGHYAFPYCEPCRCDLRGTTDAICDEDNAECYCKQHVLGAQCSFCAEGTFNLQKDNDEGCTKCFCFGKTTRCQSSLYNKTEVGGMQNWTLYSIAEEDMNNLTIIELSSNVEQLNASVIGVDLTLDEADGHVVYFSAPAQYLGNKLTSYGGLMNYTIFYTISDRGGGAVSGADVILYGANMYLLYQALEQPPDTADFQASLTMVENNFHMLNGMDANREHLMLVLEDLKGVYIRATYWESSVTTRLSEVSLDIATRDAVAHSERAVSVEHCQCPPNYRGLSCEECAPGYYRVSSGPHGGYCVPCQCNGHADECDVNTGVCIDCKHSTRGEHCEMCDVGYHGNALQGTPMDCLICACPVPITSNNFATGCEFSASGEEISCDCLPGYFGARCESCAAGFYGQPELQGDYCKPCNCSGNIDTEEPGSCDSVSGDCLRCLNNTYGQACALCAPGYFGDAILRKNCQTCDCDPRGTARCDSYSGRCECLPNVIGEKCDSCLENHYGFNSGQGCSPCDCHNASESTQCDDATGQCRCRSGVTGRMCDRCAPGFWDYTEHGCVSCGCNTEYSLGFGCNAQTGQCECLPGVIGEKCDHCPYRWVLILNQGCFECDSCIHDLLDTTDSLRSLIDPVISEFDAAASGYFTSRRLIYINNTYNELKPQVDVLDINQTDILAPILSRLEPVEHESKNLNRRANFSIDNSVNIPPDAEELRKEALKVLNDIKQTSMKALGTVYEINNLSFDNDEGPGMEEALLLAERMLKEINEYEFSEREHQAWDQMERAEALLEGMKEFEEPILIQTDDWKRLKGEIEAFDKKMNDMANYTTYVNGKVGEAETLIAKHRRDAVQDKIKAIEQISQDSETDLLKSHAYITNASALLANAHRTANKLNSSAEEFAHLMNDFNATLITPDHHEELLDLVDEALNRAQNLSKHAELLDHILSDTRNISENAVGAANAYKNIVNATESARQAADEALDAAEQTNDILDGLEDKSIEMAKKATELLDEANEVMYTAEGDLKPQLDIAAGEVNEIAVWSNQTADEYKAIVDRLDQLGDQNYGERTDNAIDSSKDAVTRSQSVSDSIADIVDNIEQDKQLAKQIQKDSEDARRFIQQIPTHLNTINTILPNITNLIDKLGPQQEQLQHTLQGMEDKIKMLNKQIATARELANKIKVGVTFFPNTTLQLRNPPDLADQSTSTHASVYFKTDKPNGFIMYLGNEKGTKLRRTKTDDYMSLEIENGYPVLTMDIGNEPERIVNDKYVADGQWYQAVIDRTGPNVKLTIREQLDSGRIHDHVKEEVLTGPNIIFNLDQEQSRVFVGGYPASFDIQDTVKHSSFDGQMEELVIGEHPVSLWNFVDGDQNHVGAAQRNKLLTVQPFTGYMFDGNSYAILDPKSHQLTVRTEIEMKFKTSAKDGLLFLVGNVAQQSDNVIVKLDDTFMAIEIRDGRVLYQYNLGDGVVSIHGSKVCNDGVWHTVKASRDARRGVLEIDNEETLSGQSTGKHKTVNIASWMFFGGFPTQHPYDAVTNIDFDGCIDNVTIISTPVDLSQNMKTFGVQPGCPTKFANLVSFEAEEPGYIRHPNVSSANSFKVSLKFKTRAPDGLILYATDRSRTASVSLALVNRTLVFISQGLELRTAASNKYNDNEWHVVTITHNEQEFRMDVDDWESRVDDQPPPQLHFMYGDMYIAGLPDDLTVTKGATKTRRPFAGCIGEATLNGMIINFAGATEKVNDILGTCILDIPDLRDYSDLHKLPVLTKVDEKPVVEQQEITEEPYIDLDKPKRGDGGLDEEYHRPEVLTEAPLVILPETTPEPPPVIFVDTTTTTTEAPVPETTTSRFEVDQRPEIFVDEDDTASTETDHEVHVTDHDVLEFTTEHASVVPSKPASVPADQCALPMEPAEEVNFRNGFRFGTQLGSKLIYEQNRGRYRQQYDFSIDFKTTSPDGLILYVADAKHSHFVGLVMTAGRLKYVFNCGVGDVKLESDLTYNDGLWHSVVFSRNLTDGKLVVDDKLVAEGQRADSGKHLNITPPYYIGAVPSNMTTDVKVNLKSYNPFNGCLRNFHMNGKPMLNPRNEGVMPCSNNIESGTFFGAQNGYMKLMDRFKVGTEIDIQMDIKPRNVSGLLMSVFGKRDFLVLQMVDGVIKFTVDNGKGPIEASFQPPTTHYFCDGHWHSIQAIKSKNVVSLSVDKTFADAGVGQSHSTDTRYGLFLGGHQHLHKRLRGIQTKNSFAGCIKDVHLNNMPVELKPEMAMGDVMVGVCPTN